MKTRHWAVWATAALVGAAGCTGQVVTGPQETVGAGGISYGLRTIPVMTNVARRVADLAPDAWVINFNRLYDTPLVTFKSCPGACGDQIVYLKGAPQITTGGSNNSVIRGG